MVKMLLGALRTGPDQRAKLRKRVYREKPEHPVIFFTTSQGFMQIKNISHPTFRCGYDGSELMFDTMSTINYIGGS